MANCFVGIDPAFRKNGFVICIIDEENTANFKTFEDFRAFIDWLFEAPILASWCIENSNMQNVTFNMLGSKNTVANVSRDVGKNMAISQATVDICRHRFGRSNVLELSPKQKGAKIESNEVFLQIVKQEGVKLLNYKGNKNEQDKRDAFMLAIRVKKWQKMNF